MKPTLSTLLSRPLTSAEAHCAFAEIMSGTADPAQVASLLTMLATREPTIDELVGVAQAMREKLVPIPAPANVIDTCGTGGVASKIFNVSTAAALVAAACGVPVAKHGNRGITSRSGSADVLKLLGVNTEAPPDVQARCLREANICFAFAPHHHPAMKHVAAIRQSLGFATVFNLAGPLTNPAGARRQLVGVKSPALADKLLAVLLQLGAQRAMLVSGRDISGTSLCELSVSGPTYIASYDGAKTRTYEITPRQLGLPQHPVAPLEIESSGQSATLIRSLLSGSKSNAAARDIVLLNAAAALWVAGQVESLAQGLPLAAAALDTHAAEKTLEKLVALTATASA